MGNKLVTTTGYQTGSEEGVKPDSPLLTVANLHTYFVSERRTVRAVDDVSFSIPAGDVLGMVGESGSGKSVCALSIPGLISPPGRIVSGRITLGQTNLRDISAGELRAVRGRRIGMIFQEPMTALNPVLRCGTQILEMLETHAMPGGENRVQELLDWVGIPAPDRVARAYPHELSGGMRQRVMIAMAVACEPELLIADEPTTALDVTVQAQILELLDRLRRETGMAVLFISHDLGVIANLAARVAVMYAGQIQELAARDALFRQPRHPYTQGLMAAMPGLETTTNRLPVIPGQVPDLANLPQGCRFAPRCPLADEQCRRDAPPWTEDDAHGVRCWKPGETADFTGQLSDVQQG
jgi:oligopeptide/dipeptide ABC transporter ATP-binding protein